MSIPERQLSGAKPVFGNSVFLLPGHVNSNQKRTVASSESFGEKTLGNSKLLPEMMSKGPLECPTFLHIVHSICLI